MNRSCVSLLLQVVANRRQLRVAICEGLNLNRLLQWQLGRNRCLFRCVLRLSRPRESTRLGCELSLVRFGRADRSLGLRRPILSNSNQGGSS